MKAACTYGGTPYSIPLSMLGALDDLAPWKAVQISGELTQPSIHPMFSTYTIFLPIFLQCFARGSLVRLMTVLMSLKAAHLLLAAGSWLGDPSPVLVRLSCPSRLYLSMRRAHLCASAYNSPA